MSYDVVIGLEVHAELLTASKIFCPAAAHFGGEPNSHVSPISLGLPGSLPVLNQRVLEMGIMAGLATHCQIATRTKFDRKHYFYPDLPKGYQITQSEYPIAEHGWLDIEVEGQSRRIRLNRIHMEEDAGKLIHAGADRMAGSVYSLVDYNRAGVPLLEIVSEPDLRSSEEARIYLEELRSILMAIGVCDGKMQEGSLRCDANISLKPRGSETLGTRVEIKNINSFRFLQKALDYEIQRQRIALETGEALVQETRLWDENSNRTLSMRSKEEAHDYRYMPDPDLIWYEVHPDTIHRLQSTLAELPTQKRQRYQAEFGISPEDAQILVAESPLAQFFEATVAAGASPQDVVKSLLGDIQAWLNSHNTQLEQTQLTPERLADLLAQVAEGVLSGRMAKQLLSHLFTSTTAVTDLIAQLGLKQISDSSALESLIAQILKDNPQQVQQYLSGKDKIMGYFVGQIMKQTQGQAEPGLSNQILRTQLEQMRS